MKNFAVKRPLTRLTGVRRSLTLASGKRTINIVSEELGDASLSWDRVYFDQHVTQNVNWN